MATFLPLERYPARSLNVIASLVADDDVRVVLSNRVTDPLVVALGPRTLLLDPVSAGLRDLFLGARMMGRRKQAREAAAGRRQIAPSRARRWTERAWRSLEDDFSGFVGLPGWYAPARNPGMPRVVWDSVPWKAMEPGGFAEGGGMVGIPGLEFHALVDDFAAMQRELAEGRFPLEQCPELRMPVAQLPLSLAFSEAAGPDFERIETVMEEHADVQRDFSSCYQRKSCLATTTFPAPRQLFFRRSGAAAGRWATIRIPG